MNPPSGPRRQRQQQKQKQKTLRIKKPENTLEFHSRLIEAAESNVFRPERSEVERPAVFFTASVASLLFPAACEAVPFIQGVCHVPPEEFLRT
jgi:hypothetical protein